MIHELLLALSGYPGSIFTWNKRSGLQVSQDFPFLHPSETSVLNRLCRLGTDYIRFTEFIEQYTGHVQQQIHGCQILETVYKHSCGGLPPVRSALEKILAVCHGVMYKQLSAWMLHGLLLDQHEEFFIKQGPSSGNVSAQPEEDEEDLGIGGLTGKQLRELQDLRLIEEENMLAPSLKQFSLRVEILPSYIPVRVAEKILFVGESVQMFENQNVNLTRKGSILKNQEDTFAAELHRLKQQALFSLVDFEQVVDHVRSTVAEHLWKLMVEESDLLGQLKIIKDFYLLGRGELFQAFIDTAQHMLKTPPTAVTEHDVNVAFQQSAHKVLLDDDNLLPLLHLTIEYHGKEHKDAAQAREGPSRETSPREAPASGWAALGLSYKVQWPLHILFTPAVLEKYNVVFKYLLSVRRVQAELQHCWALQMQRKHLKSNQTDAVKWRLRNHMAFLVDNLQYYLQVDVLESQFSQLLHQINSTRDFESIRLAHDHFLSNLLAQSFILLKPVFHCLNEILDLCHGFCSLVSQNLGPLDERGAAQLGILVKVSLPGCWPYAALSRGWRMFCQWGISIFSSETIKHFPQYIHTHRNNKIQRLKCWYQFILKQLIMCHHLSVQK
ncbi:gamma-tubulin complex component 4 isoform X4 [Mustela putorius furo]|uniref:Gamma-tubulin complex component n=1 Tax=Mustela putorius furo TaxID=9669 RepID=A0A8U0NRU5_MUSPF|nr:gamma-tubulin complex component 4 isoform X4 [Mustela putorius furo]